MTHLQPRIIIDETETSVKVAVNFQRLRIALQTKPDKDSNVNK